MNTLNHLEQALTKVEEITSQVKGAELSSLVYDTRSPFKGTPRICIHLITSTPEAGHNLNLLLHDEYSATLRTLDNELGYLEAMLPLPGADFHIFHDIARDESISDLL